MNENLVCKVAFVGAGYMTSEHLKAFKDMKNVELVGIFSRTKSRAEKLAFDFGIADVFDSISAMYEVTKADLVVISVPELSVRDVCLEVFKHPWKSLIEKPVGYDLADAQLILEKAKISNSQSFVALNRRHYSSTQIVLADLFKQEGPRVIHVYDQEDQIAARLAGQPELVVKNWMYANSIHVIDLFSILGRGVVISVTPIIKWIPETPKFVMAKIQYDSGDIGIYEAVWNAPGPWAVTVSTKHKRWEMRPLEQAMSQASGSRRSELQVSHEWDKKFKPGLRYQAAEAVKAAQNLHHSLPTLSDAINSMRLIKAIYGNGL
jgi:predicted dehydrogenase